MGKRAVRGSSARVVSLPRGMPEATGDDGNLGARAWRGNGAARGASRATAGSGTTPVDAPRARDATSRTGADAPSRAARCPSAAAAQ